MNPFFDKKILEVINVMKDNEKMEYVIRFDPDDGQWTYDKLWDQQPIGMLGVSLIRKELGVKFPMDRMRSKKAFCGGFDRDVLSEEIAKESGLFCKVNYRRIELFCDDLDKYTFDKVCSYKDKTTDEITHAWIEVNIDHEKLFAVWQAKGYPLILKI